MSRLHFENPADKIDYNMLQVYIMQKPELWRKTHKKKYSVEWCIPAQGYRCQNKFEGTTYVAQEFTPILIKGTCGELWMTTTDSFIRSYRVPYMTVMNEWKRVYKDLGKAGSWQKAEANSDASEVYFAYRPPQKKVFQIRTSWGAVLTANDPHCDHGDGDFVVCRGMMVNGESVPDIRDMWVVNGNVFENTYNMRGFAKRTRKA